ncbi:MAG: hypothetical protein GFH27_549305n25 [Chloroflexi bacterium AL-W]|nr:hypothetical protein [Chloroflexi bacterium AL-N1]NOK69271.1 hypothetical protein [Chloroflexi bacterium AL-N10]NOK76332.1 hypothetical protein [Chloroflexi bacterium AL-N5]NOK83449.1 hypothetical protein [Chloroflexi bacterium AL-W]NOK91109.1 hypothetical protein [Chloroflexi bacterium AL-N15]
MTRHQQKVLVVSELHSIYSNIQRILTTQGLYSTHVQTVDKASIAIEESPFHIIILDGRLPQITDFYQHLRHTFHLPVLVLTENNSAINGVASVVDEDDCLHLSFDPTELIDAVRTVRQRCNGAKSKKTLPIHLGSVTINLDRFEATGDGEVIRLTRTEWALLEQLILHANTTLTHQVLLQRVWGDAYVDEYSYLHTYVRRLRRKLESDPANPRYLITDVGIGYRLVVSQNEFGNSQDSFASSANPKDTTDKPHQLTPPPTSFLGREHKLNELQKLLERPDVRLLTLTGPPGVGKTRRALHLVERVRDRFADGAHVVSLAPLQDSALVVSAIAQALEIKEVAQQPIEETLKQTLQKREVLLLLDNFEHVLDAAPVLVELIIAAPHLTILVTSRTPLRVVGEQEYLVAPLEMPDATTIITKEIAEANPAVQLFVQRSQSVKAEFALTEENAAVIAAICTRLDGLPLAIELAAARSKLFTPESLLARLDERLKVLTRGLLGVPERHQTLRATLEWSYNLLTPEEQQVLMGLSVFAGGCTLEAAAAVLDSDQVLVTPLTLPEQTVPPEPEPIDLSPSTSFLDKIASLVDHSLLQVQTDSNGDSRFVLLETVREYAWEKLQESGNLEGKQQRYAEYYLWLVERAAPELERAQQQWWMNYLTEELENIRTVIASKLNEKHFEMVARLASGLRWFCYVHGHCSEAQNWIIPILNHQAQLPIIAQIRLLTSSGFLIWMSGNTKRGQSFLNESLLLSQRKENMRDRALSLRLLGWLFMSQGGYDQAKIYLEQSLELYEIMYDRSGIASTINSLGGVIAGEGDFDQSINFSLEV